MICYNFAGVLKETMGKCVAGASVQELCCFADNKIVELTSAVYKKEKDMKKGNAHFLYFTSSRRNQFLKKGRIDKTTIHFCFLKLFCTPNLQFLILKYLLS